MSFEMIIKMQLLAVALLLALDTFVDAKPFLKSSKSCGYQSCHAVSSDKLNVHLVPHSHDDVGWLKTVDQYYYGDRSNIQHAGVQYIIGSTIDALRSNPDRRFIQVESAFFWEWWKRQSDYIRNEVRNLVNSGRLEMVNGAWSMNDEAASHYQSIIDQFTWGLRMINDTLGECGQPKIGWQIDPFGHSREMASLFTQLGYEALFFARLDYRDSDIRHNTKNLELVWRSNPSFGNRSDLFTGVLYDFYTTPAHFCWDVLCSDTPINDNEESPDYNEKSTVERFAEYVTNGASFFKTNNLLVTMGGDFTYQAAEMFFNNMDKLIKGFKKYRPDINVIYSTPSCYVKSVNEESSRKKVSYQLKTDDFFPYASGMHTYWTGYFTSRPNSKRFERQANNLLQTMKHLTAFNKFRKPANAVQSQDITLLKEVMGIMQHHDAITGTEKQHVANDYVRLITKAIKRAESNVSSLISDLLRKNESSKINLMKLNSCLMANVSVCPESNENRFLVVAYNPLSVNVSHYIRLPTNASGFNVVDSKGQLLKYDISPVINNFTSTDEQSIQDLVFLAEDIPPLGIKLFYVEKNENSWTTKPKEVVKYSFGSKTTGFTIDKETGLLASVTMNNVTLPVTQTFMYYLGSNGSNYGEDRRASGAYIFRPTPDKPNALDITNKVKLRVYEGKNVDEVHQEYNSWIKQVIRIYKTENLIEFDWSVGPLNKSLGKDHGIEIITRFTTDLATNGTFFTDSNGRQMITRTRNYRQTYNYTNEEPASGNYYPITSRINIRDVKKNVELSILNDRAQGGSSLKDGEVEIMVHRRLFRDDAFGVGEALNEQEFGEGVVVRGQHYLVLGKINANREGPNITTLQRNLALQKQLQPWIFLGNASNAAFSLDALQKDFNLEFSGLRKRLPSNIHLLTLESWHNNSILLRLEHFFEKHDLSELASPVEVDLKDLFDTTIVSIKETTLGANQWIEENERLNWNITSQDTYEQINNFRQEKLTSSKVLMQPMEIRTFVIEIAD